ncbi:uncharacterized protein TRAVEDRAFT_54056 [Trametes versicolor FP-101664 SS1]|uniref:F-box domain-containing protein n=1 Tax=Trametes versicolor (strain FP-101664) TaxID=717944 RepID=R7S8W8_TRAVS|nr:uncharacterized protein TRAVEDRAFT_54056 [Trametes versicolor FP-101664 SS1]EIW52077.1 hypothetical protein TRAVEDRAFT_54056 [Trametes versicolor FP-101664 SS1]
MSRLANRVWEHPPRAPDSPEQLSVARISSSIKFRSRAAATLQSVLSSRLAALETHHEDQSVFTPKSKSMQDLPPELLLRVFMLCQERPFRGDTPPIWDTGKLMLVCSRWRALILDTSMFWRHISATPNFAWLTLCLERSRGCTLDLEVLAPRYASREALALILPHAPRIRSIFAQLCVWEDQFEMLRPFFDAGMPALETLELTPIGTSGFSRTSRTRWNEHPLAAVPCPRWLVADQTNPLSSTSWRSLRVLKLSDTLHTRHVCTCSIPQLLRVLAHNISLEELSLHFYNHLFGASSRPASRDDTQSLATRLMVSLHHLRALSVQGSFWFVSAITQHLVFPRNIAHVDIRVRSILVGDASEEDIVRLLLPRFRPVLERMTEVVIAGDRHSHALLYSPRPRWRARRAVHDPLFSFSWGGPLGLETHLRPLMSALSSAPVRNLTLKVSIGPHGAPTSGIPEVMAAAAFWAAAFDALPLLERLVVIVRPPTYPQLRVDLVELLRALQPTAQTQAGLGEDEQCYLALARCPLLTRVSIHGELGFGPGAESLEALEALADCMRLRGLAAAPVEELDLHLWYRQSDEPSLDEQHRAFLAQAGRCAGLFVCKLGRSAGCLGCR